MHSEKYPPIVTVERDPNDPNRIIATGPGIEWLATRHLEPPPSLEKLVEDAGGAWHQITPQSWEEFHVEMEKWKLAVRWGDRYAKTSNNPKGNR